MNKDLFQELTTVCESVAKNFSNTQRQFNYNKEVFNIHRIEPLSDTTAALVLQKDNGLHAFVFMYHVRSYGWKYFLPTDSHVLGMSSAFLCKRDVEKHNASKRLQK